MGKKIIVFPLTRTGLVYTIVFLFINPINTSGPTLIADSDTESDSIITFVNGSEFSRTKRNSLFTPNGNTNLEGENALNILFIYPYVYSMYDVSLITYS